MQPMQTIALRAARAAADVIMRSFDNTSNLKIEVKQKNDFVTHIDKAAERVIISTLKKSYPNHSIHSEEAGFIEGSGEGKDYVWIIDPLDGTTNFMRSIPQFAISIACQYRGRIEHGIVLDPLKDEAFGASRGYGATLNNKRIRVSKLKSLNGALIGTGIPFMGKALDDLDSYLNMMRALVGDTIGIRRCGAASLDLAYVACGRFDAFWEMGLNRYDLAAGVLIVQEAGGICCDFLGGHEFVQRKQLACGTPKVLKELLNRISPFVL